MTTETKKDTKNSKLAVIKTGGKQYLVGEGQVIKIEKLDPKSVGKDGKITFDEVLMISEGDKVNIGTPNLEKAKVEAELVEEGRDKKVSVVRYRSKSRHFVRNGHRQPFMRVRISKI